MISNLKQILISCENAGFEENLVALREKVSDAATFAPLSDEGKTVANIIMDAVQKAFDTAVKDDAGEPAIVLLSPACASFDMYDNYAHRGNDFVTHVNALGNK